MRVLQLPLFEELLHSFRGNIQFDGNLPWRGAPFLDVLADGIFGRNTTLPKIVPEDFVREWPICQLQGKFLRQTPRGIQKLRLLHFVQQLENPLIQKHPPARRADAHGFLRVGEGEHFVNGRDGGERIPTPVEVTVRHLPFLDFQDAFQQVLDMLGKPPTRQVTKKVCTWVAKSTKGIKLR